ncbi:MAG: 3-methyl-2-oxobutanoate dehydrogenase subunit VorB [Bdellovibrionales bacterium GWB1_55_8]|nr:MAG: 3-methyl-2-oxobutanoate dehydrogenase subunit VorB [Bdellovibrionales bacterium GWB1_55_8]
MKKELIKGNEAVVKAAILAGCTHYFGYPITPASEIAQAAAHYLPLIGGTFVQAESEVAAINMVYGAASAGARVLTASSSPGMSLKQEGISYLAGAELPAVLVDVMRAGPGLGNIWPEQSDYNQMVKGGGHGDYKNIVLAPNCAQEMCDMTLEAFDLADKYRCTAVLLTDGSIGQTMEPVEFPDEFRPAPYKDWAVYGDAKTQKNLISSIYMSIDALQALNRRLQQKYAEIELKEQKWEDFMTDDAELVVVAYGITSRVAQNAIEELRAEGRKVGMLRPKTLFPFPKKRLAEIAQTAKVFLAAEMSAGQMIDDVKLAIECKRPVEFYGTCGGSIPTVEDIKNSIMAAYKKRIG